MQLPQIILTEQDSDRLTRLLEILPHAQREAVGALEDELARAEVVASADVPCDVVTMNSRVVFEDMQTGRRSEALLVYPHDVAGFNGGAISVLAPVGSALLGMRAGQSIEWRVPSGKLKRYLVLEVERRREAYSGWIARSARSRACSTS
jgi:regulator of nucleoside diphosphate kinase